MVKILHFADAHIDMSNYGRRDPESGLPLRVMDFLRSLDTIVDAAIEEKVDLVIFAGDAYKDRNPAPTFQREWGKRIMRLSGAKILTLLLVGNHDLSPALGRAHALDEFNTLEVPDVKVLDRPQSLSSEDLGGLRQAADELRERSCSRAHRDGRATGFCRTGRVPHDAAVSNCRTTVGRHVTAQRSRCVGHTRKRGCCHRRCYGRTADIPSKR